MKKLEVNNLHFGYKKSEPIFDSVTTTFTCPEEGGYIVSLMGPSGSGKSTLLKLILGMIRPDSGNVALYPADSILAYVPQEDVLFEHLSPKANAAYFKHATAYRKRFNQKLFDEVTASLNMSDVLNSQNRVDQLSGGEKQRLALLRALSINPDVLLLDEPCTGLDSEVKHSFLLKLRELARAYNLLVIYVTHHLDEAKLVSDQIAYLVSTNDNHSVDLIYASSVEDFIQTPPSIKAVQMVYFPSGVLLRCNIIDNTVHLARDGKRYLLLKENNINPYSSDGWEFRVVSDKGMYLQVQHPESANSISMPNQWGIHSEKVRIGLQGTCALYNSVGVFLEIMTIKK